MQSNEINTGQKGALGEAFAVAWLILNGFDVFRNCALVGPVDLVAMKNGEIYLFDVTTASTLKQTSDFSALTVWGVFEEPTGDKSIYPALMLADSWAKRLPLHGEKMPPRLPFEQVLMGDTPQIKRRKNEAYVRRCGDTLGLVEWVAYTCERFGVSRLLIESASNGEAVASEMRRLYSRQDWSVQLITPTGDKYARAMSVVPLFTNGRIYAPIKDWAEECINQCSIFPFSKHDDILDSVVHAIRWARDNGLLSLREEVKADEAEANSYENIRKRHKKGSLYPV